MEGWGGLNWDPNVKGSTSCCKLRTEKEKLPEGKKSSTEGGGRVVCKGHGEKPIQRALKGHLAVRLLPVLFLYEGFPFIPCHASHVLLRRSLNVFMSVGVPYPEEGGLMCVFVSLCAPAFSSLLSINNIGERNRETEAPVCFSCKARCFSLHSPKLCKCFCF